jgi:predicted anti-sigma-YlaC factor YlaD
LARRADAHLTSEEMDSVLDRPEREGGPIQEHLSACDVCRTLVRRHAEEAARMNKLKVEGAVVRGSDCPPESTLLFVTTAGNLCAGQPRTSRTN